MPQKTILITGSSRGIGRSIAMYFAARGYHVFINCRTSLRELEKVRQEIDKIGSGLCTIVPGDVAIQPLSRKFFKKSKQPPAILIFL